MNKLIIEGAPPYDGEYEFEDFTSFKNRELKRIKKLSGVRVGEFKEALSAGDNDLVVALAAVILERAGKDVDDEVLWEADGGFARFEFAKDDAEDPTQASPMLVESDFSSETDDSLSLSGNGSSESSDHPEKSPSPTGALISETPISVLDFGRNPSAS